MTADGSFTLYAAGYNAVDNYLGDFDAEWTTIGMLDSVSYTGSSFTFDPIKAPAAGYIIANIGTISDTTGIIMVRVGALHQIHIQHGFYSDTTIYVGTAVTLYVAGYDKDDNFRSMVTVNWADIEVELTGTLQINFPPSETEFTGTSYTTSFPDTGRGRIIFNKTDTTAFITVIENPLSIENRQLLSNQFILEQNYPNPFNPDTQIRFQLPKGKFVSIEIYDILGRQIRALANRNYEAGYHSVNWDGRDMNGNSVTSGVYIYKIQAGAWQDVKKMVLLR